jgi:hypothetical protein
MERCDAPAVIAQSLLGPVQRRIDRVRQGDDFDLRKQEQVANMLLRHQSGSDQSKAHDGVMILATGACRRERADIAMGIYDSDTGSTMDGMPQ